MKLERLIAMIYKLLNHEVVSASVLAEEFQVSQRTIYRDIEAICAAGFPVVSFQGVHGGYGMMDGYKMDRSLLGSYDVDSLVTVLSGLSTVFEDARVQGTIERLQTIEPERRTPSLTVDFKTRHTDPEALRHLRAAIAERMIVRFDYINAKNERTTRHVEPVRLHFKYGAWYVYGWCRTRRDYREFRLSRMMHLVRTEQSFEPHREVPVDAGDSSSWQAQVEDVVIRVEPEALAGALDQFHHVEKELHPDGRMTMRIPVYEPLTARWLWSILLGFGGSAEVLEPVALRSVLKEQLQIALKRYKEV